MSAFAQSQQPQVEFDLHDETILHTSRAPELILLAAIRAWLRPFCAATGCRLAWRDVWFAAALNAATAEQFDALMRGVHGQRKVFESRCRCCAQLASDEASLLEAIGLLQRGRYNEAVRWFADRVGDPAAERLACNAWQVAEAFADAGLIVPLVERDINYLH